MNMKKILLPLIFTLACVLEAAEPCPGDIVSARNVILLIADGTSIEQYTFARWFKGEKLSIEKHRCGSVMTYIADSVIADSAPAATAFATGCRTADKYIAMSPPSSGMLRPELNSPPDKARKPLQTILEKAERKGLKTGIVVTCHFTHATPAAFFSHTLSREDKLNIARQAVDSGIDVLFGAGTKYLLPRSQGGLLPEGENLKNRLKEKGYQFIDKAAELAELSNKKVWGLFAPDDLLPEIDRLNTRPNNEPSLAEMTAKAIEILASGEKGFFLMVEGSQIDWACHANDPGCLVHEIIAFDEAAKIAFDFAEKRNDTLVIALSDHNTGGFSIGNRTTDKTYSRTGIDRMLDPVKKMKRSSFFIIKELGREPDPGKIKKLLAEFWGINVDDKTARDLGQAMKNKTKDPQNVLGEFFSLKYTIFGWTTHGHCGGDVPLAAYGPGAPQGSLDSPEIGRICAKALQLDTNEESNSP